MLVTDTDLLVSRPRYTNVLQSPHSAWMFLSEAIFYGGGPWTHPVALTVASWRSVIFNNTFNILRQTLVAVHK